MRKEEIIKKAWLELNFEPDKTDANGYIDYFLLPEKVELGYLDALLGDLSESPRKTLVRPKSLNGIEIYDKCQNTWIKVTNHLPPFGKRVLFRAMIQWRKETLNIKYFDDELTREQESLEYGITGYILKDNSDYIVCQEKDLFELYDEYVTHWMEIPEIN